MSNADTLHCNRRTRRPSSHDRITADCGCEHDLFHVFFEGEKDLAEKSCWVWSPALNEKHGKHGANGNSILHSTRMLDPSRSIDFSLKSFKSVKHVKQVGGILRSRQCPSATAGFSPSFPYHVSMQLVRQSHHQQPPVVSTQDPLMQPTMALPWATSSFSAWFSFDSVCKIL